MHRKCSLMDKPLCFILILHNCMFISSNILLSLSPAVSRSVSEPPVEAFRWVMPVCVPDSM